ncbi:hypothetical protein M422DRAFT_780183 [Sphaerobolus stellatus SS14]|uniref:Uncharacterized protein n=1 Tax=Sphaerobolus stellatus (strain SS14) TaxID=990650 RepID=A0A0C9UG42_SPHS4|nr:hypothetical protein M422DRAFT_780183 [Sphaerobolus stellatus SS14]
MHFQLSAILSLSVLAVSTMASPQFLPGPGVTLTFADGTIEHFPFGTCIPSAEDGLGSTVLTATFSEAVICTLFKRYRFNTPRLPTCTRACPSPRTQLRQINPSALKLPTHLWTVSSAQSKPKQTLPQSACSPRRNNRKKDIPDYAVHNLRNRLNPTRTSPVRTFSSYPTISVNLSSRTFLNAIRFSTSSSTLNATPRGRAGNAKGFDTFAFVHWIGTLCS